MTDDIARDEGTPFPQVTIPAHELDALMAYARYDQEDGTWYGEITDFDGLWGHGATEQEARDDLRSALQEWISLAIWRNQPLPMPHGRKITIGQAV